MKKNVWEHALGVTFPCAEKILLKMKLTLFIILFSFFGAIASETYSQTTKLSLDLKNTTVKEALETIENQSEFFFLYSEKMIDVNRKVNIEVQGGTIEKILDQIFEGSNVSYIVKDRQIILTTPEANYLYGESALQQSRKISGKVTDSSGIPLPGVTVVVKGTTSGVITDANGKYSLASVPSDATLAYSFIGMKTQEISVSGKTQLNVTMAEETIGIEEVVAVGYGTQKKINLTGSVVQVGAEELAKQTVTSAAQAIQGRVTGVEIVRNNGEPSAGATIRIRGVGTFGSTSPLVLIDGIEGNINLVSPQDIESVNVLKDASAGAIYGTRAANGVIIITTKKGQTGTSKIQYNFTTGINQAIRIPDRLKAREFTLLQNEALINANMASFYSDEEMANFGEGTDWVELVLQTGIRKNHNLQFSGGTEKLRYSLMADLLDEEGSVINSWYKRYNVRLNLDTEVTKWLKIGLNSFVSHSKEHVTPSATSGENNLLVYAIQYTPTISPKVGGMEGTGGPRHGVPSDAEWWGMDPVTYSDYYSKNRNYYPKYTLTSSFYADFRLMEGLNFKTTWGIDKYFANNKVFYASYTYYDSLGKEGGGSIIEQRLPQDRYLTISSYNNFEYTVNNLLTYTKTLNKDHNLMLLVGHEDKLHKDSSYSAEAYNFPTNDLQMLGLGTERKNVGESAAHWSLRSFFGRLNYDYKGRYLVEFSVRRDASSKFAEKYRWGTFPSGSAGWRISDENFMKRFNWLDDMKIRASYGVLGGDYTGGLYESYSTMNLSNSYPFNNTYNTGAASTSYANPAIKWEVAHMANIGVDMTMFKGSLIINAEYFTKKTTDLILPVQLPQTTGIKTGSTLPESYQNIGKMRNTGFEYSINYFKKMGDFKFDIRYTGSHMKNEVLSLQPGIDGYFLDANYGSGYKVGEPFQSVFGYNILGIYQTQEEINARLATITERGAVQPGDYIYEDTNGDNKIDPKDVVVQGSSLPSYIFGLTVNASYRNFDFNIHIQGDIGKSYVTSVRGRFEFAYYKYLNNYDYILERWRGAGTSNSISRISSGDSNNTTTINTHFIQDASYGKIRHLELGYTLPTSITHKIGIQNLRIFCNVANLAYITKYEGFEVERTGALQRYDVTPQSRTISVGANVQF